jgi:hypothetical protein
MNTAAAASLDAPGELGRRLAAVPGANVADAHPQHLGSLSRPQRAIRQDRARRTASADPRKA